MATYNQTKVYLYSKIENDHPVIYRVPVVAEGETFFYNHEPVQAIIYTGINYQMSVSASIHLTNQRLIFISQSDSMYSSGQGHFDTCELVLANFQSLKHTFQHKNAITFHIITLDNLKIRVDLIFPKDKTKGRESLCEYLGMAVMDMRHCPPVQEPVLDNLPTYLEAICPPPSYFN